METQYYDMTKLTELMEKGGMTFHIVTSRRRVIMGTSVLFTPRKEAPEKTNPFYYSNDNIFHRYKYGMPNCTCYALGRVAEITGEWLDKSKACRGNAETWYDSAIKNGLHVSQSPRIGSVACWSVGDRTNGKDGAGHVAVVEAIDNVGNILTSNSADNGTEFYNQYFYAKNNYCWKSKISGKQYDFIGFIYPTMYVKEPYSLLRPTKATRLKQSASSESPKVKVLYKISSFIYDGVYYVAEGVKWGHGRTTEKLIKPDGKIDFNPKEYSGWVNLNHFEKVI